MQDERKTMTKLEEGFKEEVSFYLGYGIDEYLYENAQDKVDWIVDRIIHFSDGLWEEIHRRIDELSKEYEEESNG